MSVVDDAMRAALEERAGYRCEYCRLPMRRQIATFPLDHLTPRSGGGLTVLANLALACPNCNGHKWAHTSAPGPASAEVVPLFNPRVDRWEDHLSVVGGRPNGPGRENGARTCYVVVAANEPSQHG